MVPFGRLPPLNALRAFEAVARHGSVTKAAEELCVTQSAVSRHIRTLEERLGFPLFQRTGQGLEISPSSQTFAAVLNETFVRMAQAADALVTTQAHSILTIRAYTTFLTRWLIPALPDFHRKFPHIEVRLVASSEPVNFERDAADVGIRYGSGRWRNWRSDPLFFDDLRPIGSPDYVEQLRGRCLAEALPQCTLLHHNRRPNDWADWLALAGVKGVQPKENLFFEDIGIAYECARAGLGLAMGQHAYVLDDLSLGRLIEPFPEALRRETGYFLVCPESRAEVQKIAAFREWVLGRLQS
ncbi:transcriptional regulator [Agaricicola taiwanensis]|uniref:Transcriptional regulator n=2 Tax=Agaricicola taiwanensis TaxID=591372 RepID=A0A8J2YIM8_9RHOB|nr:transcriptional regulator [Agaricicola taiwanensis]